MKLRHSILLLLLVSSPTIFAQEKGKPAPTKAEAEEKAKAEPPSKYKPGDRVVLTSAAKLVIPGQTVGELPRGIVATVRHVNGPWIWIRSGRAGWLDAKYVVPLQEGVQFFTAQLARNKNDNTAYVSRAHVYRNLGDLNHALQDYSAAIKLDPDNAFAIKNRAYTHFLSGNHKAAVADYGRVVQLDPQDVTAWKDRGYNHYELGQYAQALADYDAALKLNAKHVPTLNKRAWLLATCPDEKVRNGEAAMASARQACELAKPVHYEYIDTLAAAYAAAGYFGLAVTTAEEAIKLAPPAAGEPIKRRMAGYRQKKAYHEPNR
jgi:tetratricopeptide (TPR) repeat protein